MLMGMVSSMVPISKLNYFLIFLMERPQISILVVTHCYPALEIESTAPKIDMNSKMTGKGWSDRMNDGDARNKPWKENMMDVVIRKLWKKLLLSFSTDTLFLLIKWRSRNATINKAWRKEKKEFSFHFNGVFFLQCLNEGYLPRSSCASCSPSNPFRCSLHLLSAHLSLLEN